MKRLLLAGLLACSTAHGAPPLVEAVRQSDQLRITSLLAEGVDVNAVSADGMAALHWAVQLDETETAKRLLDGEAKASVTNRYGITPLWLACRNGNSELVEMLLSAGADPNDRQIGSQTVLMTAARAGNSVAVKSLLQHGADVNASEARERGA
jgi:ankyrin repeat protein